MILLYRYRLLPTRRQHRAIELMLESQRELYNAALEERIGAYKKAGRALTFFDQCRELTEWRHSDPDASLAPLSLQRATLKRLDNAFRRLFRGRAAGVKVGFPRFRGRGSFKSFGFLEFQGIRLEGSCLHIKSFPGSLQVHFHRPLPSKPRTCSIKQGVDGWTVMFAVDVPSAEHRSQIRAVGIDLGISTFAALSDGGFIPSLRAARRAQGRIKRAHRAVNRKRLGSKCRARARVILAKRHAAVSRCRMEHLHQASARLVRDYDLVAIEAINVGALSRSMLARDVRDASWGKFIAMLRYKAVRAGVQVISVNCVNTSQECSGCGGRVQKELSCRLHACSGCGLSLDRDLNAARNILRRAGVGPYPPNVAGDGMRAGGSIQTAEQDLLEAAGITALHGRASC